MIESILNLRISINKWTRDNPVDWYIITLLSAGLIYFFKDSDFSISIKYSDVDYNVEKWILITLLIVVVFLLFIIFKTINNRFVKKYKDTLCEKEGIIKDFQEVGLVKADQRIETGMDAKTMLSNVNSNFMFLGTGANKLTSHPEQFNELLKCGSVKFLVCDPESKALEKISSRAKTDYINTVKASVERLKEYVDDGHDLELRLYKADLIEQMPIFRLAFFNKNQCLCSYNFFSPDTKDGTQLPQLHIVHPENSKNPESFYFAFNKYFERLWELNECNTYTGKNKE
ncbi:hypothetical protein K1B30_000285 [Vibrio parahaemolyticus]|nr:hypothetical protein [Vibrio parahaemolyticus]EIU6800597.1 hypothetical protein [Vibrio parahaemolyticus]